VTHPKLTKLFFAGTDTDVGKTYTAALVAAWLHNSGKRVGVYKPVASGCISRDGELVAEDAVALWEAAGSPRTLAEVCPQRFAAPLAPPEAAAAEAKTVDASLLRTGAEPWIKDCDVLIIEGAGGLFSPLADGVLNIDLAKQLGATLVVVAANRLGVIHQVLATCGAAEHAGLKPRALFLCNPQDNPDDSASSNPRQIAKYCDVPILGRVPYRGQQEHVARIAEIIE
jgi:dethiobiotin synthetase